MSGQQNEDYDQNIYQIQRVHDSHVSELRSQLKSRINQLESELRVQQSMPGKIENEPKVSCRCLIDIVVKYIFFCLFSSIIGYIT